MLILKHRFFLMVALFVLGLTFGLVLARVSGGALVGLPKPVAPVKNSDGPEYSNRQPVAVLDLVKLFPKIVTRQGNTNGTAVALTFDDGPDLKYTPQILDTLKKFNVKATFFCVGTQIQKYPATFKRIYREGHEVGNHSYQHLKVPNQTEAALRNQIIKNNDLIRSNGVMAQPIYRPPYGALDPKSVTAIGKMGFRIILWTVDSLDWRGLKKPQVVANVLPTLKKGYIVLQHSAADSKLEDLSGSIQALPDIIATVKAKGYRFVTISQLLKEASATSK